MKKLSEISESVWGDIRHKSLGKTIRQEDTWIMDLIKKFCVKHNLKDGDYTINNDMSVDVYHSIQLYYEDLVDNRIPFKFHKIKGDFRVLNVPLETLENAPDEVTGDFVIGFTNITNLEGSPRIVGKTFCVNFNKNLVTLDGSPDKVGEDYKFYSSWNMKDIKGISPEIGRNVVYSYNPGRVPKFSNDDFRSYSNIGGEIIRR